MDAWLSHHEKGTKLPVARVRTEQGIREGVKRVDFSLFEQVVICGAGFFIKPVYELISLLLIILLWKSRDPDLTALRHSMIAFFIGENACTANYLFYNHRSLLMEYLHMYGMLVCFGLAFYALMRSADIRVFHFSELKTRCTLLPLCIKCYKYQEVSCNLRLIFLFVIPAVAVLAFMPLTAVLGSHFVAGNIFGEEVVFGQSRIYQLLEVRIWPITALIFFLPAFIVLLVKKEQGMQVSKILFAAGLGPLGFSFMRFLTYWGYAENPLWADTWEEVTEFLFISFLLWIIVRIRMVQKIVAVKAKSPVP
jgi:hypothetical protein